VDSSASLASAGQGTVAFLTSPSLLTLQLPDATFRRHILAEIMMLLYRGTRYNIEGKDVPEKMVNGCEGLLPRVRAAICAAGTSGEAFKGLPWHLSAMRPSISLLMLNFVTTAGSQGFCHVCFMP
jgi:hypothetical protein